MEDQVKEAVNEKCPGKLDFNAPILSARQPTDVSRLKLSHGKCRVASWDTSCNRVPFSWEQSPGKPKDMETVDGDHGVEIPAPKLPPGRWHPSWEEVFGEGIIEQHSEYDDGCDADDEDDEATDGNSFPEFDIFSLCESVADMDGNQEEESAESEQQESIGSHKPNFIIERFLPDARALAASSSTFLAAAEIGDTTNKVARHSSTSIRVRKLYKNCGLDSFLPWWRTKPKLCRWKTKPPVLVTTSQWHSRTLPRKNS